MSSMYFRGDNSRDDPLVAPFILCIICIRFTLVAAVCFTMLKLVSVSFMCGKILKLSSVEGFYLALWREYQGPHLTT